MTAFQGRLHIDGEGEAPISVEIDLSDERLRLSTGGVEVADWARDELRVTALTDGFHVRAEGELIVLDVIDDARFALELGLRTAHPLLRRKMSALMRDDDRPDFRSVEGGDDFPGEELETGAVVGSVGEVDDGIGHPD